jgi:hypothetical protein
MKKKLVLILFMIPAISLFGFEAGTKSLGGRIGLSNYKFSDQFPAATSLSIRPTVSYFILDNICLDIEPVFGAAWQDDYDTSVTLGIGLGARYFFKNFYFGGSFFYSKSGPKGSKYSGQFMELKAGHLLEIAKHVFLDFSVTYQRGLGKRNAPTFSVDNDSRSIEARVGAAVFF